MADLVLLTFDDDEFVRCSSLDDAKTKAMSHSGNIAKASVQITPEGGGPVLSLEFDFISEDWIASA